MSAIRWPARHGSLVLNADGSYGYVADASVDALLAGDNVTDQFTFTVDDGQGHQASTTLTFNIAGANDNPLVTVANLSADRSPRTPARR